MVILGTQYAGEMKKDTVALSPSAAGLCPSYKASTSHLACALTALLWCWQDAGDGDPGHAVRGGDEEGHFCLRPFSSRTLPIIHSFDKLPGLCSDSFALVLAGRGRW